MIGESSKLHNQESILRYLEDGPRDVPLHILKDITDDFSDERQIGQGGYGVVYKGVFYNGKIVAVKKLMFMPGVKDTQFQNEVHHLLMLKHQNIVQIVGYCSEIRQIWTKHEGKFCFVDTMPERLLCLEYIPNGSLERYISDESCGLDWPERFKIIKGISCGLHYLHEEGESNNPIIHLDLKPANILLTMEMEPKITDFGLSRLFGEQQSRIQTTRMMGTRGYMAREYVDKGIITKKSDIFSFGVIIIEIITGHRDYPEGIGTSSTQDFIENVVKKWKNHLENLGCTSLEKDCEQIKGCIVLGLKCVQIDETQRPTTKEIIKSLNGWDSMVLPHVICIGDQVLQNGVDASQPLENDPSNSFTTKEPRQHISSNIFRTCAGCHNPIDHGRFLSCMGSVWHPQCFRCFSCNKPISEYEFAMSGDQQFHRYCYKEFFHPKCDVCDNFIQTNRDGLIEYRAHPFWMQKYCPSHEDGGTPRCCSCERMEPRKVKYITLDDGRKLCLECLNSSIMDTPECQHLYMDIQKFFEGLNVKVEQQIPLLLVQRQALNEAWEAEEDGHHLPETRGLCLSKEQIVRTILKRPQIGPGNRILDMITGPYKLSRRCEVTAILILYGLPRLQTGSILAHEMMHAYLRLKGFRNLGIEVEEGICQVLSHMWLESEIIAGSSSNFASSSAASSSSSSAPTSSKKGAKTEFEKKLGAFIKNQIETDSSEAYGDGFRAGYPAVQRYGLKRTLDHIKLTGSFPY